MALFKSRKGGDEPAATARQAESVEAMRRRAKHRLIGASVLVLIGVVGFPLLFDTQPRPISVDIPIEIPDRNKVDPLPAPAPAPTVAPAHSVTQAPAAAAPSATAASLDKPEAPPPQSEVSRSEIAKPVDAPKAEAKVATAKTEAKPAEPKPVEPKPAELKSESKPAAAKPPAPADDGVKAQALLDGKPVATTPVIAEGRFVVQVGAFSDAAKARETRSKLERAGMKTYTQVVDTKSGTRIRVRVGPFASKADAEKAAQRVKGLELQAAVLTLS